MARRKALCAASEAGETTFTFDPRIYAHADVKAALITAQHGKCCFCETKICDDGDVEHFRPKAGFRQSASAALEQPGYFWLAYEWDNLLLCCSPCNSRHKGNLFPLEDNTLRVRSYKEDLSRESPLFIHPAHTDPVEHIAFDRHDAKPVNGSVRGRATIDALGLNRASLTERRLTLWNIVRKLQKIIERAEELEKTQEGRDTITDVQAALLELTAIGAEYAAMTCTAVGCPLPT